MSASPTPPIEVFISYSHKDEVLREQLGTHLSLLRRRGVIDAWHDRRIGAGQEWAGAIDEHLNSAAVILLLISPDFLASDYCYDLEMTRALPAPRRRGCAGYSSHSATRGSGRRALCQTPGAAQRRQAGEVLVG